MKRFIKIKNIIICLNSLQAIVPEKYTSKPGISISFNGSEVTEIFFDSELQRDEVIEAIYATIKEYQKEDTYYENLASLG